MKFSIMIALGSLVFGSAAMAHDFYGKKFCVGGKLESGKRCVVFDAEEENLYGFNYGSIVGDGWDMYSYIVVGNTVVLSYQRGGLDALEFDSVKKTLTVSRKKKNIVFELVER
jgi:hypothetical protein